jgi:hypothetical protein
MRALIVAGVWVACLASLPEAHLLFSKNGSPVFEFRDDGTVGAALIENHNTFNLKMEV